MRSHLYQYKGFILDCGFAGFPQFGKKCHTKFTLPRQMGRKKNRPKDKFFFLEEAFIYVKH